MPNNNTTNRNQTDEKTDDHDKPRKIEYIEPIETPFLKKIEPTASFAIDLFQDAKVYPFILSRCLVHFRPSKSWESDKEECRYGFDWLRVGDSGGWDDKKTDSDHYANLIGKHYEIGKDLLCDNINGWTMLDGTKCEFRHKPDIYKSYISESFPKAFYIPIKSRNPSICSDKKTPNNIKKLIDRSRLFYSVPILLLRAMEHAEIRVKVEYLMPKKGRTQPKDIVFREHTPNNGAFTITPDRITAKDGWQKITITSMRAISRFEQIDAFAIYDDPANPGSECEEFCGQLRVHPNDYVRDINLLFVTTEIYNGTVKASKPNDFLRKDEKTFMRKVIEGQLLANLNIQYYRGLEIRGNFTYDDGPEKNVTKSIDGFTDTYGIVIDDMTDILTAAFRADLARIAAGAQEGTPEHNPERYKNYSVVFLVDLPSRVAPSVNMSNRHGTIYKKGIGFNEGEVGERLRETLLHEVLHTLGLWHTFNNTRFTFRARETANIMDYSHVNESQDKATGNSRYFLWLWQIKQIWNRLDKIPENKTSTRVPKEDTNIIPVNNESINITQYVSHPRI